MSWMDAPRWKKLKERMEKKGIKKEDIKDCVEAVEETKEDEKKKQKRSSVLGVRG